MTQPDTHDHPGGAAQPTVSELPDNAAELTSAVYIKDLRYFPGTDRVVLRPPGPGSLGVRNQRLN